MKNAYFCITLNTDKIHIQHLAKICAQKGIAYAVISPGSRCAPLIIAFNRQKEIQCLSVIDERSAGFIALGLAQQSKKVVALICTSGSAILNYAPALAEAYYQKVPLLVLSADRPNEWIDQGENQSINQVDIYKNYIKKSYQLPLNFISEKDLWYNDRLISEAINSCIYPDFGPVHINIPLREPLYNLVEESTSLPKIIEFEKPNYALNPQSLAHLGEIWKNHPKTLIVIGGNIAHNEALDALLEKINSLSNVVILKEAISNIHLDKIIDKIDGAVECIDAFNLQAFKPDLIITLGGGIVSKKLKFWLRKQENVAHWHLTQSFEHWDIFQSLSKVVQVDPLYFFEQMLQYSSPISSQYKEQWLALHAQVEQLYEDFIAKQNFIDFNVFDFLAKQLPPNALIQLGNSTPVRYANLLSFKHKSSQEINSNRGVSGIDGVLSTAVGASLINPEKLCFCITGDVAAAYDSNAWLNNLIAPNFKVILINNQGGNIFKIIPGPNSLEELNTFFVTQPNCSFEHLAKAYDRKYFYAESLQDLQDVFTLFVNETEKSAILEIKTNGNESSKGLKNYFDYLKEHWQSAF